MEYNCTACGQKVPGDMMIFRDHTEKHIVDLIKVDHPEWTEKDGICQKCLQYFYPVCSCLLQLILSDRCYFPSTMAYSTFSSF